MKGGQIGVAAHAAFPFGPRPKKKSRSLGGLETHSLFSKTSAKSRKSKDYQSKIYRQTERQARDQFAKSRLRISEEMHRRRAGPTFGGTREIWGGPCDKTAFDKLTSS